MSLTAPSAQEAYNATNPDPTAYGLPPDAPTEDVQKRREEAAQNLLAGAAANAAYWNSRTELEALRAQSEGHGQIVPPPDHPDNTAPVADVEGTAVDEVPPAEPAKQVPSGTPDNPAEAVAKLRAQVEAAGLTPDA